MGPSLTSGAISVYSSVLATDVFFFFPFSFFTQPRTETSKPTRVADSSFQHQDKGGEKGMDGGEVRHLPSSSPILARKKEPTRCQTMSRATGGFGIGFLAKRC